MRKITIAVILMTLLFTISSFAQTKSIMDRRNINNFGSAFSKYSLLDPAKFDMKQQFIASYQTNGKQSLMSNMYVNTLSYQFSKPLSMKIHLGVEHQPSAFSNILENDQTHFLPGVELTYQPSENFLIHFEYSTMGRYQYRNEEWRSPFWKDK